jgi:hypothetical protein
MGFFIVSSPCLSAGDLKSISGCEISGKKMLATPGALIQ